MPPLLLDLDAVPACHCDSTLEHLFKAMTQDPAGQPDGMWAPHENPWLTAHVEEVTQRLQRILEAIQDAMALALSGEPIGDLAKAEEPWLRWDADRFAEVGRYLRGKPPLSYTLDDWLMLANWLVQRYLPDGVIQIEAEFATVRAAILGKIQSAWRSNVPAKPILSRLAELVPTAFGRAAAKLLTPTELEVLRFAKARAAEAISDVAQSARHTMRMLIVEHVQAQVLGQKQGQPGALRQRLFDSFGQLNRDFRRIAVTEVGECCNQGVVAAARPGQRLQRREAYRGACEFCRSIDGKVFTVVAPDAPTKNGQTEVWVGKTNIGRSAAPRRRVGGTLLERTEAERWWPAAGVQHPNCRGAWLPLADKPPEVSDAFATWLADALKRATASE